MKLKMLVETNLRLKYKMAVRRGYTLPTAINFSTMYRHLTGNMQMQLLVW